jgi:hypothetical protein
VLTPLANIHHRRRHSGSLEPVSQEVVTDEFYPDKGQHASVNKAAARHAVLLLHQHLARVLATSAPFPLVPQGPDVVELIAAGNGL